MNATSITPATTGFSYGRLVILTIAISVVVRLICAANMPLAADEVLYWRYSRYLAPGFLDHPGMNPFLIRVGTTMLGDTPLGIRLMAVLSAIPASWAMWRAAALLFKDDNIGATTALLFNITVVMSVGSLLATSDASVVTTSALLIFALAKVKDTGRGVWWLAVGAAFGLGMFSKYTTVFFGVSILAWLALLPAQRRWFTNGWPYAGAVVALLVFLPVILWNAEHQWASLAYQSSRMVIRVYSIEYLLELIASQIGLLTPAVFFLTCVGFAWGLREKGAAHEAVLLLALLVTPGALYFMWHSLHERVQGNWPECLAPALICAAGYAAHSARSRVGGLAAWAKGARLIAAPMGVAIALLVYTQAVFGVFDLGRRDPTSRELGPGWHEAAAEIDAIRANAQAHVFLTTDYKMASSLAYYLPAGSSVQQINDRIRWVNEPTPADTLFSGQMIYVCKIRCAYAHQLGNRFRQVQFLGVVARRRDGEVIERYELYRVADPMRPTLDALYPIRTKASDAYVL